MSSENLPTSSKSSRRRARLQELKKKQIASLLGNHKNNNEENSDENHNKPAVQVISPVLAVSDEGQAKDEDIIKKDANLRSCKTARLARRRARIQELKRIRLENLKMGLSMNVQREDQLIKEPECLMKEKQALEQTKLIPEVETICNNNGIETNILLSKGARRRARKQMEKKEKITQLLSRDSSVESGNKNLANDKTPSEPIHVDIQSNPVVIKEAEPLADEVNAICSKGARRRARKQIQKKEQINLLLSEKSSSDTVQKFEKETAPLVELKEQNQPPPNDHQPQVIETTKIDSKSHARIKNSSHLSISSKAMRNAKYRSRKQKMKRNLLRSLRCEVSSPVTVISPSKEPLLNVVEAIHPVTVSIQDVVYTEKLPQSPSIQVSQDPKIRQVKNIIASDESVNKDLAQQRIKEILQKAKIKKDIEKEQKRQKVLEAEQLAKEEKPKGKPRKLRII